MVAHAHEGRGRGIAGAKVRVVDKIREKHVSGRIDERVAEQKRAIGFRASRAADGPDDDQPRHGVHVALIVSENRNQAVEPLVRNKPSDEEEVRQRRVGKHVAPPLGDLPASERILEKQRKNLRVPIAHVAQFGGVERTVGPCLVGCVAQLRRLPKALFQNPRRGGGEPFEVAGRRDVVVKQDPATGKVREDPIAETAGRQMQQRDVVRPDLVGKRLCVPDERQVAFTRETAGTADVGCKTVCRAKVADQARLVADGVALPEAGDKLVENGHWFQC